MSYDMHIGEECFNITYNVSPMFQDIAPMMSDRSLVHYALNGKTWERATAKMELRRRIAAGRVDNIAYDDAVALGLAA